MLTELTPTLGYLTGLFAAYEIVDGSNNDNLGSKCLFVCSSAVGGFVIGDYVARNHLQPTKNVAMGVFVASLVGYPLYKLYQKNKYI